jgi:tripartite-type tricarboxylate transporter receptor subunit TctC
MMRILFSSYLALLCLAFGSAAFAQESADKYPSKPIRIIVTFPAGGPTDFVARAIGQSLSEAWGQTVVIDNRPGAGGNIGMNIAAKAPPDGYTLVLSSFGPMVISPFVYSSLPYDPIKDLTPITLAATNPFFFVVRPSLPATTVSEFVALAKAKPGGLTMSSSGIATPSHLAGAFLQSVAGISLTHVPYKGAGESIPAVVNEQVDVAVETPILIVPQVKAGKLRALLVSTAERSALLPDVPTGKEVGLPDFVASSWYGFHAPAGTPKPIIDKINAEMVKALRTPEMRERFASIGANAVSDSPAEFTAFVEAETAKWGKLIRAIGVKVE